MSRNSRRYRASHHYDLQEAEAMARAAEGFEAAEDAKRVRVEIEGNTPGDWSIEDECTLAEFIATNTDLEDNERIRRLPVGAYIIVGGGAAPFFKITRLS